MKENESKETLRLETFSDGVYAIAITLLVLELKVPRGLPAGESLAQALLLQWPVYVAFLMSFGTIGVTWINHHRIFNMVHRSDNRLLVLNLLLLLTVTIVPFPTFMLAEYLRTPDASTAAMIYSAHGFNLTIAYNLLWRHATGGGGHLLRRGVDRNIVHSMTRHYRIGTLGYLVSFGLAFWSVAANVALNATLAIGFAFPPPLVGKRRRAAASASVRPDRFDHP